MAEETSENGKLSTKREINWLKILFHLQHFLSFLVGLHFVFYEAQWKTIFFSLLLMVLGSIGVTAGNHRLWAHNSYTASTSLQIFLMLCTTLVGNGPIYDWVRWHRLHHKHHSTDLDPFNAKRGFFYSHMMGNVRELSQAQEKEMEQIDMNDIETNKVVMFQKRYYYFVWFVVGFLLPVNAPAEYWGETLMSAIFITGWVRYTVLLHVSYLIHSATHIWALESGERFPCNTNWVFLLTKTFWIPYHYTVPWDYQTGEYGSYGIDVTTKFIKVCAALDLASDLRTVDTQLARKALIKAAEEHRNMSECIRELIVTPQEEWSGALPNKEFLTPSKYYVSGAS